MTVLINIGYDLSVYNLSMMGVKAAAAAAELRASGVFFFFFFHSDLGCPLVLDVLVLSLFPLSLLNIHPV